MLRHVARLGVRTLDGDNLRLVNRSNDTTVRLSRDQRERWEKYLIRIGAVEIHGEEKGWPTR